MTPDASEYFSEDLLTAFEGDVLLIQLESRGLASSVALAARRARVSGGGLHVLFAVRGASVWLDSMVELTGTPSVGDWQHAFRGLVWSTAAAEGVFARCAFVSSPAQLESAISGLLGEGICREAMVSARPRPRFGSGRLGHIVGLSAKYCPTRILS